MLFTARLHVPYATNNMDQGSAWRGSKYFYFATYPGSLIALIPDRWTIDEFEILSVG
jgi:hypothetical protein